MIRLFHLPSIVLAALLLAPGSSYCQKKPYEPTRGSEERKTHMALLRKEFMPRFNGQKLIFEVNGDMYKSEGNWAVIYVNVFQQGGKPVNFRNSKYKQDYEEGMMDSNGIFGLFRKTNSQWKLIAHADFPTDVPIGCWWKEYKAPKSIFGNAAQDTKDCL